MDENTHPGAHLRVPNHPPSEDLHVPLSIELSIHLYSKMGFVMFVFVDDRLMDDHFMMIKKMIKMDHLFGSFYDHQK